MAETRPTVHVRAVGGRYHIRISGPNRAYAVQCLREALPGHARCYRAGDGSWSTTRQLALVAWLMHDRTVLVDWPEAGEHSA